MTPVQIYLVGTAVAILIVVIGVIIELNNEKKFRYCTSEKEYKQYLADAKNCELTIGRIIPGKDIYEIISDGEKLLQNDGFFFGNIEV